MDGLHEDQEHHRRIPFSDSDLGDDDYDPPAPEPKSFEDGVIVNQILH